MVRHEIESHVQTITWSDLWQRLKKPQQVQVIVPPTPLPGPSRRPDYSHLATYGQNYARRQYQCFECGDPTHFKWDCPFYNVKHVDKQHLDMHYEHVMDASMMMEFVAITILKENTMETSPESVDVHVLFTCVFLFNYLNRSRTTSLCHHFFLSFSLKLRTNCYGHNVSSPHFHP
jgi:hypothetical protein